MLPESLKEGVQEALAGAGMGSRIESISPVGGGCINNGAQIRTDLGVIAFLKWNATSPRGMFAAEADGLDALRGSDLLRVPEPIAWSDPDASGPAWLLMEFVPPGLGSEDVDRLLGRGLARLHMPQPEATFGWHTDNWIGSLPQANSRATGWSEFWRDMRLNPQLERARGRGRLREDLYDRLITLIPRALGDVTTPCLIHGDLWGGNTFASEEGEAVVIDPAVYLGDGEVDLAMTELFGGFSRAFYEAYRAERPISDEYNAYRRDLYQLYYLLVHVNLFGSGYEAACRRAARAVLDSLS